MVTRSTSPVLSDDHIDLLITAATTWHVLINRTAAALASGPVEHLILRSTPTQAGRALREANTASVRWIASLGRERLVDRIPAAAYEFRPVQGVLDPVEVIKATHAAQQMCSEPPSWTGSSAQRLLGAVLTAAEHRLEGYAAAPWSWTRPEHRGGPPVGVAAAGDLCPPVPGLRWVEPEGLRELWGSAAVVVVRPSAAGQIPVDLPARPGVVVMITNDEHHDDAWAALLQLAMPASQVWFWPQCQENLSTYLGYSAPSSEDSWSWSTH